MTREAFICDAVRTLIGRYGGAVPEVRTDGLATLPIKALMTRNPRVDWSEPDDVILACANRAGEDNRNIARMAALRRLGILDDAEHMNPNGGTIALGHPLGMSGARLVMTASAELHLRHVRYALCTRCVGVGQGLAMVIQRV